MLWRCRDCSTLMAVGLERCPHCNRNHIDKGVKTVAKTTALGWGSKGTNALDPEYQAELEEKAKTDARNKARREKWAEAKEGAPSPGNSSPESTEKPETKPESGKPSPPSPAKTTEPRSKTGRTANGFAGSADDSSKDKKAGK